MASTMKSCLIMFFACSLFIQAALAEVICENLPENLCAFAVASSGKRCVLEKTFKNENASSIIEYTCSTSEVVVEKLAGHLESDQCVAACGVDRRFVGYSSDKLMKMKFLSGICSPPCNENCPNIVDLYFNLAAREEKFLPDLCEIQKSNGHRILATADISTPPASAPAPAPSAL
ncbi:hypothetical protein C2S51_028004 [Perilla frutescens var. frutescens]|nr:hypothetical protein C2S51_028004 [Perilla frutescens var. frutescens]